MNATWNTPHVYEQHGFTYRSSEYGRGYYGFDVFYGDTRIAYHVREEQIFPAIVRFGDAMSRD